MCKYPDMTCTKINPHMCWFHRNNQILDISSYKGEKIWHTIEVDLWTHCSFPHDFLQVLEGGIRSMASCCDVARASLFICNQNKRSPRPTQHRGSISSFHLVPHHPPSRSLESLWPLSLTPSFLPRFSRTQEFLEKTNQQQDYAVRLRVENCPIPSTNYSFHIKRYSRSFF